MRWSLSRPGRAVAAVAALSAAVAGPLAAPEGADALMKKVKERGIVHARNDGHARPSGHHRFRARWDPDVIGRDRPAGRRGAVVLQVWRDDRWHTRMQFEAAAATLLAKELRFAGSKRRGAVVIWNEIRERPNRTNIVFTRPTARGLADQFARAANTGRRLTA